MNIDRIMNMDERELYGEFTKLRPSRSHRSWPRTSDYVMRQYHYFADGVVEKYIVEQPQPDKLTTYFRLCEEAEEVKEYVVISKEMAERINSMANVECHEVAPSAELKRLAEVIDESMRKKRGGER